MSYLPLNFVKKRWGWGRYFESYSVVYFFAIKVWTRFLEMMSDAPTNAGKHITPNIACVRSQQSTPQKISLLIGPIAY